MTFRPAHRRAIAGTLACLGAFAVVGQFGIIVAGEERSLAGFIASLGTFLKYFTLLTNALLAATLASHALPGSERRRLSNMSWATAVAVYITIVAVVYHAMLRMLWNPQGFQKLVDVILHYVQPAAYLVYWALLPKVRLSVGQLFGWLLFPFTYGLAILAAGAITGQYPYPFADVGKLGIGVVLLNLVAMLGAFLAVGALYRWFVNRAVPVDRSGA